MDQRFSYQQVSSFVSSDFTNGLFTREKIILPFVTTDIGSFERQIYDMFVFYLRQSNGPGLSLKILSAIEYVASCFDTNQAQIAKVLVDLGLRAPRTGFPPDFLNYVDAAMMKTSWEFGSACISIRELYDHWLWLAHENRQVNRSQGNAPMQTIRNAQDQGTEHEMV